MKTSLYILLFFLSLQVFQSQAQTSVYRGMIKIKENKVKIENNTLSLDLNITLSGMSVGRHQSLMLTPVLQNGGNSFRLKPIVINGLNKQKMYKREKAFNGKATVDDIAYVVLKSDPTLLQEVAYQKEIPFRSWMEHAELVLVGELLNYDNIPIQTYTDILTDDLDIRP